MKSKFGFLIHFTFLQSLTSKIVANINPAVLHNLEKYIALLATVHHDEQSHY